MIEKNTIWAIVLSTLVIIGSYLVLPLLLNKPKASTTNTEQVTTEQVVENKTTENFETKEAITPETESKIENAEEIAEENIEEEVIEVSEVEKEIKYETDKVEIVFTTKGGDIKSFKLKGFEDTDSIDENTTDKRNWVELVDNLSSNNRACSISLGTSDSNIVNDIFVFDEEENKKDKNVFVFKKLNKVDGKKLSLRKTYKFIPEEYMFKLTVDVYSENGLNIDGAAYTIRTSPQMGPVIDPDDKYETRQFVSFDGKKSKKIALVNGQFKRYDKNSVWAGIAGNYFEEIVVPEKPENLNAIFYSSKIENKRNDKDYANAQALFERKAFNESKVEDVYYMYFGPRDESEIRIYNMNNNNAWGLSGLKLGESVNSSWLRWLETILKWCLDMIYKIIPNYGICIILLTILLKLLMFPLSKKQSMGTLKMQELQPKIQAVQEKYKDDKQRQQLEMQKIYQEAHYNPASGCLPLIFQFLILIAMYTMLRNHFGFFNASFIPGWIPKLCKGDVVYKFATGNGIPLLGKYIRILPIVYVVSQILFSIITQNGGASAGQSGFNMKLMTYGMPILFFFMFYSAPSGLLIYWITSNIFQMVQQLIINRMMKSKKAAMANNVPAKKTGKSTKK